MRTIQFRGKRVDNGEWLYGDLMHVNEQVMINPIFDEPYEFDGDLDANVHPETVGQYTGLQDKNGKEIYEGDIVKSVALLNDHHQRGAIAISPVEYSSGNACLLPTYTPLYPFCINHEMEIIGNIHDNPELLK